MKMEAGKSAAGPPLGVDVLAGTDNFPLLTGAPPMPPFGSATLEFLSALSKELFRGSSFRQFPEMAAFAYWIREAKLREAESSFRRDNARGVRVPRGTVFHIAPSNVDTIFLYSLTLSMLAGNRNIVRISSKESPQVRTLLDLIARLLAEPSHAQIANRLSLIRYERDTDVTRYFSGLCDVRVVWGGNNSIAAIRALPLRPYATELLFADKSSLAVFDASNVISLPALEAETLARNFVNDTYSFGQLACSSPHLLVWRGTQPESIRAADRFWPLVEARLAAEPPEIEVNDIINKLVGEQKIAAQGPLKIRPAKSSLLSVHTLVGLDKFNRDDACGGGFFAEARIEALTELSVLTGRELQTIVSFGIRENEWKSYLLDAMPAGIDRIVKPGEALTFSPVWDGYDFMRDFTREISVGV